MHTSDGRSNHIGFSLDLIIQAQNRGTCEIESHLCQNTNSSKIPLPRFTTRAFQSGYIVSKSFITFKGSTLKTRISSFHHWTHPPIPRPEVHHLWQMNWRKHFSTTPRRLQRTTVGNIFSTCSNFVLLKRISFREVANLKHYRKHWNANGKYVDEKNM